VTDQAGTTVAASTIDLSLCSSVQDVVDAINGDATLSASMTASLDSNGRVVLAANSSSNGVALSGGAVTAVGSTSYSTATTLSSALGLNDLVTGTSAANIAVRSDILAKSTLLATETFSSAASATTVGGTIIVSSDSQIQAMADALDSSGAATASSDLISQVSSDMTAAKASASADETSLTTLTSSFSSKYGVNVDEETANIEALSQSYAASAQVVSTVKSMFESLLAAVK
jgi:flagellar hook-associated protein 1 FlgK